MRISCVFARAQQQSPTHDNLERKQRGRSKQPHLLKIYNHPLHSSTNHSSSIPKKEKPPEAIACSAPSSQP